MRGRKKKPAYMKDSIPPDFDSLTPGCPDFIVSDPVAKEEWDRAIEVLGNAGVLSSADQSTLAAYCLCYSRWVACEDCISREGLKLGARAHPLVKVSIDYLKQLKTFADQFGLTPQARTRLEGDAAEGDNELEEF